MKFRPESKNPLLDLANLLVEGVKAAIKNGEDQTITEKRAAQTVAFFIRELETQRFKALTKLSYEFTQSVERIEK
jgi:hypothetical protein